MANLDSWEAMAYALKEEGTKYVFGLLGDQDFYNAIYHTPDIKSITVRHETSGAFMAYTIGRLTGEPAVCHGTIGPGTANMVPGILEAYTGCLPVLAINPGVPLRDQGKAALQEADQVGMMEPVTKWSVRVNSPDKIFWVMRRAFNLAVNGKPGPIFIEIPRDIGKQKVDLEEYRKVERPIRFQGDPERISRAVDLLLKSERPVLVAGSGVISSKAMNEFIELAELLGIPCLTSPGGRGTIPEDHPLAMGLVGLYRTRLGKKVYKETDLLLSIGTRWETLQSGNWEDYPPDAKFIQVDIEPFEIYRNWVADIPIVGDAKLVLTQIITEVKRRIVQKDYKDMPRVKMLVQAMKEYETEIDELIFSEQTKVKGAKIVRSLNKVFGKNTILVRENGAADLWSDYCPYYKVLDVGDYVPVAEQTCMGIGVVGSIAAKLLKPDKNVVCTTGDGAFQMFMKEMPTAVQYNAPVTWVVFDDSAFGWNKWAAQISTDWEVGKELGVNFDFNPDLVKTAEANNCYGERIERSGDIEQAFHNALKANSEGVPAVLDFATETGDYSYFFKERMLSKSLTPTQVYGEPSPREI